MLKPGIGPPLLDPFSARENFHHTRFHPSSSLKPFVEHYWTVQWNLGVGEQFVQQTLPDPSVHVVFERDRSEIVGPMRGRFSRVLEGRGCVVGIKFLPGGFYPYILRNLSEILDLRLPVERMLNIDSTRVEEEIFSDEQQTRHVNVLQDILCALDAKPDENVARICEMVSRVREDKQIKMVTDLADRFDLGLRSIQRMFNRYVGLSPKWVIQRARIQDAVGVLHGRNRPDLATLANELGYADQSHFIRDFNAVIGVTPREYAIRNNR